MPKNRYTNPLRWSIFEAAKELSSEIDLGRFLMEKLYYPASDGMYTSKERVRVIVRKAMKK